MSNDDKQMLADLAKAQEDYRAAVDMKADRWISACGGLETPFAYRGKRLLYVFNPATGKHGYYNLDTDIVEDSLD